jgi:hypothetical protein
MRYGLPIISLWVGPALSGGVPKTCAKSFCSPKTCERAPCKSSTSVHNDLVAMENYHAGSRRGFSSVDKTGAQGLHGTTRNSTDKEAREDQLLEALASRYQ